MPVICWWSPGETWIADSMLVPRIPIRNPKEILKPKSIPARTVKTAARAQSSIAQAFS
jgi:hypothetical protein